MDSTGTCHGEIRHILSAVNEINEFLISSDFNLEAVLEVIIQKALQVSAAKYGQILLYNGQDLTIAATTGVVEKGVKLLPGKCACGVVLEKGEPLLIADVEKAERYHRFFDDAKSELAVPLAECGKMLGVLNVESPEKGAFNGSHQEMLTTLALQASHAIKIARMYEQQRALAEIDRALARATNEPEAVYEMIIEKSLNLIGGRSGQLLLLEGEELVIAATTGQEKPMETRVCIESSISGIAVKSKKPLNIGDVTKEPYSRLYRSYLGTMKSELVIPLIEGETVIGALNFENPLENYFDGEHVRILISMADHATVGIRNLQIYQKFHSGLHEVKGLLSDLEEFPDKMKRALSSFHRITRFFEERERPEAPLILPPTGDY
ncbi:MAG: GAF domain-containing protein [Candidatus Eremiobacteraeota bacterium]|nr:GAF domain-containing protein [Candidatus Eremiobacteraeota bacterium]